MRGVEDGWIYDNPDTGVEWSPQHPIESGEVPDAENVRPASGAGLRRELIAAWKALEWTRKRLAERGEDLANERSRCADIVEQHLGDGESVRYALYAIRNPVGALAASIWDSIDDGSFSVQSATTKFEDAGWRLIDTAPKDGTAFEALYEDGSSEREVYWSPERYCILGAPQGSKGPGCMSTEVGLPVEPTHWRPTPLPHEGRDG